MQNDLVVFENIGELLTLAGAAKKAGRNVQESDLGIIRDAIVVSHQGQITWIGPRSEFRGEKNAHIISCGGRTVIPGLIECHTHTVFAGDRSKEFEWRMQGQTYQEISARGGGILSTVRETRKASEAELLTLAQERVDLFTQQGVTTLEIKSGYGLDLETELKSLRVARQIKGPRVITTYLGAHSRSPEFNNLDEYVRFMVDEVLPKIAKEKLADRADIYIEKGFYTLEQAKVYLNKVKELGLAITAHVEQLSLFGGTELALDYAPQSVDHVVYLEKKSIERLAKMETTAVLLPTSDFYLKMQYPPARELIDAGARVALSTDFNPGTSPTQSLNFAGVLARLNMKMAMHEVLSAFTVGAAYALGLNSQIGSLEIGKQCDLVVLEKPWNELFYAVGHMGVADVFKAGSALPGVR